MNLSEIIFAYILLTVTLGKEYEVAEKVKRIPGVLNAKVVYGEYDVVVEVQVSSLRELDKVVNELRKFNEVIRTVTLISSGS